MQVPFSSTPPYQQHNSPDSLRLPGASALTTLVSSLWKEKGVLAEEPEDFMLSRTPSLGFPSFRGRRDLQVSYSELRWPGLADGSVVC